MWKFQRRLASQGRFIDEYNEEVVRPALAHHTRSLRLLASRFRRPALCVVRNLNGRESIHIDVNCGELNRELSASPYERHGCAAELRFVKLMPLSDGLISENYKIMGEIYDVKALENSEAFREAEEQLLIALARRELELEATLKTGQTSQKHGGRLICFTTESAGDALRISWQFDKSPGPDDVLWGFVEDRGFSENAWRTIEKAKRIVDSKEANSVALTLKPGEDFFLTFAYMGLDRKGERVMLESLRFSARIPTAEESSKLRSAALRLEAKPKLRKDPKSEKLDAAIRELTQFVEFDEGLSVYERAMIGRIQENPIYSESEREKKIRRVKLLVESLREGAS